jgi:hypothetical protein
VLSWSDSFLSGQLFYLETHSMDLISYLVQEYFKEARPLADGDEDMSRQQVIDEFAAWAKQKLIDNPPVFLGSGTDGLYELTLKDFTRVLVCEGLKPRAEQQQHRMDSGSVPVTGQH